MVLVLENPAVEGPLKSSNFVSCEIYWLKIIAALMNVLTLTCIFGEYFRETVFGLLVMLLLFAFFVVMLAKITM